MVRTDDLGAKTRFFFMVFAGLRYSRVYLKLEIVKTRKPALTKRAMVMTTVRIPVGLITLARAAAAKEEISQSEFLRRALRDRAKRVLMAIEEPSGESS